mgnify:CR=1 FL=1
MGRFTPGGGSVSGDQSIGDDLTLSSDGAVLSMGAGNDVTFTHDGTTGLTIAATPISINSTGDLTLDSSTDIILDAAGNDLIFKDAGTTIATFTSKAGSADLQITPANGDVEITSATASKPTLTLDCTADASGAPALYLQKSDGAADGRTVGTLYFRGKDDAGNYQSYGYISSAMTDVSSGAEQGSLSLWAAAVDGTAAKGIELVGCTGADDGSQKTANVAIGRLSATTLEGGPMCSMYADRASTYTLSVKNDGNNANRYGIRVIAGADDGSGTTYYLAAQDGDGGAAGYLQNASGTFSVADASDRRIKKDIRDTEIDGLQIIGDIKVRDFALIRNDIEKTGFVAQELQTTYPAAVVGNENDVDDEGEPVMMSVASANLIPVLVKAVQELKAKVEQLEAQLNQA